MGDLKKALRTGSGQQKIQGIGKDGPGEVSPDEMIQTKWQYFYLAV